MIDIVSIDYYRLSVYRLITSGIISIESGCTMKTSQDCKIGNDFFGLLYSYLQLLQPFNAVACHFNDKGK